MAGRGSIALRREVQSAATLSVARLRWGVKYRTDCGEVRDESAHGEIGRLDLEAMSRLVGQVARLRAAGGEVVVVSSGAQAAGRRRLAKWLQPGRTPSRQAFASVGQSHLMQSWDELFEWHDLVVAVLLTRRDTDRLDTSTRATRCGTCSRRGQCRS